MKIGILSLPLHTNYGGILQAYALQSILERMGHDVKVIDRPWRKDIVWWKYPLQIFKRGIFRFVLRNNDAIIPELRWNINQTIVEQNTRKFIHTHICSYRINKIEEIKEGDFDVIVVGSDQVWRPKYFRAHYKNIENAFLSFADLWEIKRISYAASFGTDNWEYDQDETVACKKLLQKFKAVSLREESGVKLCSKYLDRDDTEQVLDPTMLLDKEEYLNLIPHGISGGGDIMYYVLDEKPEISEFFLKLAEKHHLKAFRASPNVECYSLPAKLRIQPPVEQWLAGFKDAKFVITDSFHACVFSILFQKPFVIIGNRKRGYSRFESLLKKMGLEDRLIEDVKQFDEKMLNPLNYDVFVKLEDSRASSISFLKKALT